MKEKSLRLRLVVRRHGLPEVRIVFNVPLEHDPTVSKLVEFVNETIPLESGEWGLEDYVVELRDSEGHAFECLHFQPVATILEKDEEVFIRPLFSEDVKKRRLSGRYQISSDGKHLIDGVAFGRQRLKVPRNRPSIHISPRKRRRITYDETPTSLEEDDSEGGYDDDEDGEDTDEEDEDSRDDEEPLLLTEHGELEEEESDDPTSVRVIADFEDADTSAEDAAVEREEDGDDNFGLESADDDGDDDMDLDDLESTIDANELNALREEVAEMEGWGDDEEALVVERGLDSRLDLATLDRITALRAAFPSVTVEHCEKLLSKIKNERRIYKKLSKSHQPQMDFEDMLAYKKSLHQSSPEQYTDGMSEVSSDDEVDSVTRHFDQHGFPPGSIAAGNALSHMAQALRDSRSLNAMKLVNKKFDTEEPSATLSATARSTTSLAVDDDATSSSGSSSDSESSSSSNGEAGENDKGMESDSEPESSSSSGDSDSGSESDSGPEEAPAKADRSHDDASDAASDRSSSDSSSSDDDDDEDDADETKHKAASASPNASSSGEDSSDHTSSDDSSSDDSSSSESESDSESDHDASISEWKAATASVGQLVKMSSMGARNVQPPSTTSVKEATPVPPGQGKSKTQKRNARRRAAKQANSGLAVDAANSYLPAVPDGTEPEKQDSELLARKQVLMERLSVDQSSGSQDVIEEIEALIGSPPKVTDTSSSVVIKSPDTTSSQRRMRLDVSAGQRLLFGALGLKAPKNKPDADKIRANLMKGVRPLINTRVEQNKSGEMSGVSKPAPISEDADDGHEDWKAKINYRAVECCQEDITLSEPPFPFVQRWDPQQQSRGGKGKRKQRNQAQFYQDDDVQHASKKRKVSRATEQPFDSSYIVEAELSTDNIEPNYNDGPLKPGKAQVAAESQITDLDDLPSLPSDLSSLPLLQPGDAQVGMVITWTAWLLSSATGWQPQVSNLTGIVTSVKEDGLMMEVLLARRDRNLDRNEKSYDKETGQRVYDRFEAPDLDDDDLDHLGDEGYRTLSFSDLNKPRIVQQPLESGQSAEIVADSQPNHQTHNSLDLSTTIGRSGFEKHIESGELMDLDGQGFESVIANIDNGASSLSVSTQPGQVILENEHPQVELSLITTNAGTCRDVTPSVNSRGSNNSPSRQLEEMSEAAYAASLQASRQSSHQPLTESQPHVDGLAEHDDPVDHVEGTGETMAKVDYPNLDMLSTADSVHSGRQPDQSLSHDLLNGSLSQSVGAADDSIPSQQQLALTSQDSHDQESDTATTRPQLPSSPAASDISSASSIPSLSQVWHTASQLGAVGGPSRACLPSQKAQSTNVRDGDEAYEAAMRRLDEASDEESPIGTTSTLIKDSPSANGSSKQSKSFVRESTTSGVDSTLSRTKRDVKTFKESVSPPSLPRTRDQRGGTTGFTVPAGSQLVSLMTSSPEPEYSEYYAEDGIDDNYKGGESLRIVRGSQKQNRSLRGASLPARGNVKTASTRRVTASQAPESKATVNI